MKQRFQGKSLFLWVVKNWIPTTLQRNDTIKFWAFRFHEEWWGKKFQKSNGRRNKTVRFSFRVFFRKSNIAPRGKNEKIARVVKQRRNMIVGGYNSRQRGSFQKSY